MKFTNLGLVQHVKRALNEHWQYVYGTIGQVLTASIIGQKQLQYPDQINKHLSLIRTFIGRRTVDCVNLIKSYLWWNPEKNDPVYDVKYDKVDGVWMSADGAFQVATEKGPISTIPDIPGICVRYQGHIGVYIGNGEVIETRGTKYGVVKTKLKERPWTHWLKYPGIEYITDVEYCKRKIQANVGFSNPEGVWKYVDMHPFAAAWYQQWADSYKTPS